LSTVWEVIPGIAAPCTTHIDKLKFVGHQTMTERRYKSFSEFWPFYISEHSRPGTRILHLIGTTSGILLAVYVIVTGKWWLFPLALIPGYGGAWLGHFLIEKNKPATFQYPLWSFMGDYKMIALMITGRIGRETSKTKQEIQE